MSKIAVGAYLRRLRENLDLTQIDLALEVHTNESQIIRLEQGRVDTRGSLLMAITRVVQGSADDIFRLSTDQGATAHDGRDLAEAWIRRKENPTADDRDAEIAAINQALRGDDRRLGMWIGYGRGLVDESAATRQGTKSRRRRSGR